MAKSLWKGPWRPIKCWGCEEKYMYKYFQQCGDTIRDVHNNQENSIVDDLVKNLLWIYAGLDNRQVDHQSKMLEFEGKIFFSKKKAYIFTISRRNQNINSNIYLVV